MKTKAQITLTQAMQSYPEEVESEQEDTDVDQGGFFGQEESEINQEDSPAQEEIETDDEIVEKYFGFDE
jgi:hypothetical protein